jgi:hypothetical protein
MANDILRTEIARILRIGQDSGMNAEERNRSFFNALLYRRTPDSNELFAKAIGRKRNSDVCRRQQEQIQLLQAELDQARSQAGEAFEANEQWQKWGAYMEGRIKEFRDANQLWADQLDKYQILEQDSARKIEALEAELAKANTSLEQMDWDTAQLKIREGKSAQDVLGTVKMSDKDANVVRLVMSGMTPLAAAQEAGVKPARVMQLMGTLKANAVSRFSQSAKEIAATGITRSQLKAKLMAFANGSSLRSRSLMSEAQEEALMTEEEILAEIVKALGFDYDAASNTAGKSDWYNLDGKSFMFDWRKPSNVGLALQMARRAQGEQATIGDSIFESYVSLLVSSFSTQIANITKVPFVVTNPIYRMAEAGMSYLTSKLGVGVRLPDGTIGTPFGNLATLVGGATEEAKIGFMAMLPSAIDGMKYARLAFNTEKPYYNIDHTDNTLIDEGDQKYYDRSPKIPGPTGRAVRIPLRALVAADEFAKSVTAGTIVSSIAYRMAKAKGLQGQDLVEYVNGQVNTLGSDSWNVAVERSSRETLNEEIDLNKGEPFTFKKKGKAVPRFLNKVSRGISEASQGVENFGLNPALGKLRTVTAPVALTASLALQIIRGITLFSRISFNVLARGVAFSPIGLADSAIGAMNSIKKDRDGRRFMDLTDYENAIAGLTEGAIGTALLTAVFNSMEGDDDDNDKLLLISGPAAEADSARRTTRYGNRSYMIRIGDKEFDISRIEPFATTMGFGVVMATAVKDAVYRGGGIKVMETALFDAGRVMSQKTFGGQLRTMDKIKQLKVGDILVDFASVFTAPPIIRGLTEGSKDYFSRSKSEDPDLGIFDKDRLLSKFAPAVGAFPAVSGYRTPYAFDIEGNKVPKPFTESLPNTPAGKAARYLARNFSPVGVYKKKSASPFRRFVSSYNKLKLSIDGKPWIPNSSRAQTTDPFGGKDELGRAKKVILTLKEQETLNTLIQAELEAMFSTNITEADILNPTEAKKNKIQRLASAIREKYEKAIVRQRYASSDARKTK